MTKHTTLLTPQQAQVIQHDGSAFVNACPGAGKTKVLVGRAIEVSTRPMRGLGIAFLSFTNAAVAELESRLRTERVIDNPVFPNFIGTFDSFIWQHLVAPFGVDGTDLQPKLISDFDSLKVEPFEGAQKLPLSIFCPTTGEISATDAKSLGFDVTKKPAQLLNAYSSASLSIRERLRERGELSFGDARTEALKRIRSNEHSSSIGQALASRYCEIIIDEAQDCNPDDLEIIMWLKEAGIPVKVVCDPHQSIYQFRGGVTDHLIRFTSTFDHRDQLSLSGNFRSNQNICSCIVQLQSRELRENPSQPLGPCRDDATPVHILSYSGRGVSPSIGKYFLELVSEYSLDASHCTLVAATRAAGYAAIGLGTKVERKDRIIRLAEAIRDFGVAANLKDFKSSVSVVHQIMLELEGKLNSRSYQQYLNEEELDEIHWRPTVVSLIKELRSVLDEHVDAKGWHKHAKSVMERHIKIPEDESISMLLKWNKDLESVLKPFKGNQLRPRTIHSVKGEEFEAVCVVTTAQSVKGILDFLETGEPVERAEDARKLYVGASRAKRLLAFATPKSQANRLTSHIGMLGARTKVIEVASE